MHQEGILGVLGGMGPQATNTFYQRIIDRTQAESDQEHLRVLIWSDAKIPDRTAGILGTPDQAEAVYQHLLADAKLLERAGCTVLAIPCNTSHYFADRLQGELHIPLIHMIRETVSAIRAMGKTTVGILATDGTVRTGIYQQALEAAGLTPVTLGDSDNLVVGEQVAAIGNPLGELTYTLTAGYVSAKDRSITMENGEIMNMIQTDTAINSGNSGGPLFNMYGQVVGITSAKYSSSASSSNASIEGIGFAIPINDVKDMVKSIMENGYVTGKPNVGILMNDVSSDATQRYGIPAGAYVEAVLEGSCGEKAGLKTGDVITAVGDTAVTSSDQLKSIVKNYKAGDTVSFTIYRGGKTQTLSIVLDENNKEREQAMSQLQQSYQNTQQQQSSAQHQQQGGYSWPFGFGW